MYNSEIWFTEYNNFDLEKRSLGLSLKIKDYLVKDASPFQTIDIVDTYRYGKVLLLDGLIMVTEQDEFVYHDMISHVPTNLLRYFGKEPENALVIGGGDGGTLRQLVLENSIKKVVMCEIDGKVVDYCKKYFPITASKMDDEKSEVIIGDGVEYMKKPKNEFDVICIDSTEPFGPAVGLFNAEFYTNVFNSLKDDGVVTAQQESYFVNMDHLKKMKEMLVKIFPYVAFYRADIPTYPSGTWCFLIASKKYDPMACFKEDFIKKITFRSKYYNAKMHQGAFSLPSYLEDYLNI